MNEREQAAQLLEYVPEYKIGYVLAYLHGMTDGEEKPNEETLEAMEELKNGGGECFDTLDELWKNLEG